jgi:hypothetical protein
LDVQDATDLAMEQSVTVNSEATAHRPTRGTTA